MDHFTFPMVWTTINYAAIVQLLYIVKVAANELWNYCVMVWLYRAITSYCTLRQFFQLDAGGGFSVIRHIWCKRMSTLHLAKGVSAVAVSSQQLGPDAKGTAACERTPRTTREYPLWFSQGILIFTPVLGVVWESDKHVQNQWGDYNEDLILKGSSSDPSIEDGSTVFMFSWVTIKGRDKRKQARCILATSHVSNWSCTQPYGHVRKIDCPITA